MKRILLCVMAASAWVGPARAEGVGARPSGPLTFNIRPSRIDDQTREQQERVVRRDQQREFAFRSICTGCGPDAKHAPEVGMAFSPAGVLATRPERQVRSN